MKIIVSVVVHDRLDNIVQWLTIWKKCVTDNAELVVIHNDDGHSSPLRIMCALLGATYILRQNIGYDTGAFQDVCEKRLQGFPEFDYLIWCTDDTVPMNKNFISEMIQPLQKSVNVGVSAMQISAEKTPHVRTTGFAISNQLTRLLLFPVDPITTKQHCYEFEHGINNMTEQVRKMGLHCVQVAPWKTSPLYDKGYWQRNAEAIKKKHIFDRTNELTAFYDSL